MSCAILVTTKGHVLCHLSDYEGSCLMPSWWLRRVMSCAILVTTKGHVLGHLSDYEGLCLVPLWATTEKKGHSLGHVGDYKGPTARSHS